MEWQLEMAHFRERLVQARKGAGLTQRQAAALLNEPASWVTQSETGERRCDIVDVVRFATIYAKPLEYFAPIIDDPRSKG